MIPYLILSIITAFVAYATVHIVRRTRQWSFAIGMLVFYAWTFLGAWPFIGDALSGYQGYRIGLNYYYLMEKMFPFELGACYNMALLGYGTFFLCMLCLVWLLVRRMSMQPATSTTAFVVDHRVFFGFALAGTAASYTLIHPVIVEAIDARISIYQYTRHASYAGSSLHALCNELVCLSLLLGWAIHLTSGQAIHFTSAGQRWARWAYPTFILVFSLYLMILGNRHELLMALILSGALFYSNARSLQRGRSAFFLAVCAVPMFFTGKVRNLTWQEMSHLDLEGNQDLPPFHLPLIQHVPRHAVGPLASVGEKLWSNEFFCAHFSLYGICREHVRPAPFISARYLAASMVPRALREERPPTAYAHYAASAHLMEGQGYTIHHAAGWYINGGTAGLLIGGALLGLIWGLLMRARSRPPDRSLFGRVFAVMGTLCWVAFLPILVRDGPEIFKAVIFEGFALPMGVIIAACLAGRWRGALSA